MYFYILSTSQGYYNLKHRCFDGLFDIECIHSDYLLEDDNERQIINIMRGLSYTDCMWGFISLR